MSVQISKALIMSGENFPLTESISLKHPAVCDMLSINNGILCEELYFTYVQLLLCDPYANMVMLDDLGLNYLMLSPFDVFLLQWKNESAPLPLIQSALNFFLSGEHDFQLSKYPSGEPCLSDRKNPACQINREIFEYLHEWLKSIHQIDTGSQIKPADENARRILIEDTRDALKKANRKNKNTQDSKDYIGSLMSAVAFGGNGVITPFQIRDCKMFWLFEAFRIENKKSTAGHLLDGIYHGTISSKDINKQELDWTR